MSDEEYNGWTNWDTWAVGLWADNERRFNDQKWAMLKRAAYYKSKGKYDEAKLKKGLISFYKVVAGFARKQGDEVKNHKVNWSELANNDIKEAKIQGMF